ncbi:hypothetical protein AS593_07155 [Caulobacter vibrioides]|nr:hypothetical protein AS593_07155 [Caulobacter vibrioides]
MIGTSSSNGDAASYAYDPAGNRTQEVGFTSNRFPVAVNDALRVPFNTATTFDPRVNDSDPDGDALSITGASGAAHGALATTGSSITYSPAAGYRGFDSFTYTVTDGRSATASATVAVTVGDPPTVSPVSATVAYNGSASFALQPAGAYTSLAITRAPAHGSASISGTTATYTPSTGYFGADSFDYAATGPSGTGAAATVSVTVAPPPAPTASDVSVTTNSNKAVTITYPVTGDYAQIVMDAAPAHGTVVNSGFSATYTPASGYTGVDAWTYHAINAGGSSAVRTVTVSVVNQAPVANNDYYRFERSTAARSLAVRANDTDPDGDALSIIAVTQPGNGATVTFTSSAVTLSRVIAGTTTFTYTISDGNGHTAMATVEVIGLINGVEP